MAMMCSSQSPARLPTVLLVVAVAWSLPSDCVAEPADVSSLLQTSTQSRQSKAKNVVLRNNVPIDFFDSEDAFPTTAYKAPAQAQSQSAQTADTNWRSTAHAEFDVGSGAVPLPAGYEQWAAPHGPARTKKALSLASAGAQVRRLSQNLQEKSQQEALDADTELVQKQEFGDARSNEESKTALEMNDVEQQLEALSDDNSVQSVLQVPEPKLRGSMLQFGQDTSQIQASAPAPAVIVDEDPAKYLEAAEDLGGEDYAAPLQPDPQNSIIAHLQMPAPAPLWSRSDDKTSVEKTYGEDSQAQPQSQMQVEAEAQPQSQMQVEAQAQPQSQMQVEAASQTGAITKEKAEAESLAKAKRHIQELQQQLKQATAEMDAFKLKQSQLEAQEAANAKAAPFQSAEAANEKFKQAQAEARQRAESDYRHEQAAQAIEQQEKLSKKLQAQVRRNIQSRQEQTRLENAANLSSRQQQTQADLLKLQAKEEQAERAVEEAQKQGRLRAQAEAEAEAKLRKEEEAEKQKHLQVQAALRARRLAQAQERLDAQAEATAKAQAVVRMRNEARAEFSAQQEKHAAQERAELSAQQEKHAAQDRSHRRRGQASALQRSGAEKQSSVEEQARNPGHIEPGTQQSVPAGSMLQEAQQQQQQPARLISDRLVSDQMPLLQRNRHLQAQNGRAQKRTPANEQAWSRQQELLWEVTQRLNEDERRYRELLDQADGLEPVEQESLRGSQAANQARASRLLRSTPASSLRQSLSSTAALLEETVNEQKTFQPPSLDSKQAFELSHNGDVSTPVDYPTRPAGSRYRQASADREEVVRLLNSLSQQESMQ